MNHKLEQFAVALLVEEVLVSEALARIHDYLPILLERVFGRSGVGREAFLYSRCFSVKMVKPRRPVTCLGYMSYAVCLFGPQRFQIIYGCKMVLRLAEPSLSISSAIFWLAIVDRRASSFALYFLMRRQITRAASVSNL
jgi:hypothetical protein